MVNTFLLQSLVIDLLKSVTVYQKDTNSMDVYL